MKSFTKMFTAIAVFLILVMAGSNAYAFFGGKFKTLQPKDGKLYIPVKDVSDGKAHYFKTKSDGGTMVDFFLVMSADGVIRAAIDACDVCYRAGKGYVQKGNVMVCVNCGRRFGLDRINEVKGGCNPAPLTRVIEGENIVIPMTDVNANAWLTEYKYK